MTYSMLRLVTSGRSDPFLSYTRLRTFRSHGSHFNVIISEFAEYTENATKTRSSRLRILP
jgi:hypothetical protein